MKSCQSYGRTSFAYELCQCKGKFNQCSGDQYTKDYCSYVPIRVKVQSLSHTTTCSFVLVLTQV